MLESDILYYVYKVHDQISNKYFLIRFFFSLNYL